MRKVLTALFFLAIVTINAYAQDSIMPKAENNRYIYAKINLLALCDFTPSIQFAYQYNVYKKWHIQHEAGYITYALSPFWNADSKLQGYRIKNQIKYYLPPQIDGNDVFYLAAEVMLKKTSYYDERYFGMYDNAYFQSIRFKKSKDVLAYSILLGFEPVQVQKNLIFDFYAGMGYRRLLVSEDLPPDVNDLRWNFFRRSEGKYNLPGFYFGLRLGYRFGAFL